MGVVYREVVSRQQSERRVVIVLWLRNGMVGRRRLSSLRHSLARVSSTAGGMVWRCGYSKASTVFRNFGTGLLYLRVIILLYPSLDLPDLKEKYTSNTFQHYCSYCICRSYQAGPCRGDISSLLRGDVSPSPKGQIGNATKPPFSILRVRFDNFSPFTHSLFSFIPPLHASATTVILRV